MAISFSQDELNQLRAGFQTQLNPPKAAAPKKRGRGGTLTSLISEAGGTGGALAGAAIGTAILPVVGTAIGAGLGGALGGFGGRVAENKVRDDRLGLGDALTEGALSGVMSLGPGNVLKAGKVGLNKVAGRGASGLAEALSAKTGNATVGQIAGDAAESVATQPLKTSFQGKLTDMGNKALASQYGTISKPVARANKPLDAISTLADAGLVKPQDIEKSTRAITGSTGILNKAVTRAVDAASPVDTSHIPDVVTKSISRNGMTGDAANGLKAEIDASLELVDPTKPVSILKTMRDLETKANEYVGKGGNYHLATSDDKKRAKAMLQVRDELQNSLYNTAGANKNLSSVLTPELRGQLVALHPNNTQWAAHVDKNIMQSKSISDLRKAQAPFVRMGNVIEEGDTNAMTFGGRVGNSFANGQGMGLKQMVAATAANAVKNPAARLAGGALRTAGGASKVAPTSLASALKAPTTKGIIRNNLIGNGVEATLAPAPADAANLGLDNTGDVQIDPTTGQPIPTDQASADPNGPNNPAGGQMYEDGTQVAPDNSNDPFDPANVKANVQKILANGGNMNHVKEYLAVVGTMQDLTATAGPAKLNSTTASSLASSANGANTLNQLEGLFSQAGGGSGKLGGSLSNALSKVGMNSGTQIYNDLAASSVSQLAKALNGGGTVSDTDAAVVIQALPKITDSPAVAQAKFNALKARLAAAQQNTLQFAGSGADQQTAGAF
jgi:hypothetical protein